MSHLARLISASLICSTILFLNACPRSSPDDEQAIRSLLTERRQALTSRDFTRYLALISLSYQDKGLDYRRKTSELAAALATWDTIDYQADPAKIVINGSRASATNSYRLRVTQHGKQLELAGDETLILRREKTGWKILGGL